MDMVAIDYKHHGGVTVVPLFSAAYVALLPIVRRWVDWRAVRTVPVGRRSPLAALAPVAPGRDRVLLAEVGRMSRVGRAAVVNWRRLHADFPVPAGGTDVHPEFDRPAVGRSGRAGPRTRPGRSGPDRHPPSTVHGAVTLRWRNRRSP
ncbi:hypothetical protein OHB36_33880 [Streptomyces sp. NBC_00320]|uniref:hypothetical protein n=1 Tax=Streptomyces sp. NBC_00320 TaxID=2975711 RepID=UPI00224D34C8|nr:hypothetical protein [Streptomyces sp. NBC_00320]MCX5151686.1 hypothetical protein [Streptomyces sp. NBC_00320]